MPYTGSAISVAALQDRPFSPTLRAALEPPVPLALPGGAPQVPVRHLPTLFAVIPDPRWAQGRRFALPARLAATLAALLCQQLSPLAVAEWLADSSAAVQAALGFRPGQTPHHSTFKRVLRRLDLAYGATALQRGRLRFTPLAAGGAAVHEGSTFAAQRGTEAAFQPPQAMLLCSGPASNNARSRLFCGAVNFGLRAGGVWGRNPAIPATTQ
jgi:hypothetical protein